MRKVLVYGAGTLGLIVQEMLEQDVDEVVLVDDDSTVSALNYEKAKAFFTPDICDVVIALGYKNLANRLAIYNKVKKDGYHLKRVIHPRAYINSKAIIGEGCIIMANASVGLGAILSDMIVMWMGSTVSHDSTIGMNTFLSPNSTICGFAEIGSNSFIGAGAIVVDRVILPSNSFIKAGSVSQ